MAQKLTSLEEAADQLGISKERLNELREAGKVRAYRDGASWKFRGEDIDRLVADGIPDPGASDLSLDLDEDVTEPSPTESSVAAEGSALDLDLAEDEPLLSPEESDLSLDAEEASDAPAPSSSASDISLDDVDEPTVEGLEDEGSDALALDDIAEIDLSKDSILMNEADLGRMTGRPPSTIIGKAELDLDADLDLSPVEKGAKGVMGPPSDVRLADDAALQMPDDDLDLDLAGSGQFEGLDELEVDLEAESSRILSPEDVAKAHDAAKAAQSKSSGLSDLGLAPTGSSLSGAISDLDIKGSSGNVNLSGLSALELDDGDDEVLGEGSGSDITLSGESSGINIISPSDSGLALDEVPLDLSGSAPLGSSLDLGDSVVGEGPQASGIGSALGLGSSLGMSLGSKVGEDFQLTPMGEDDGDDEKDSSQVIALDELSEDSAGVGLPSGLGEAGMMAEDFGSVGLASGAAPMGASSATEMPFSVWNVMGLAGCILLLAFCGMMTYDLLRAIWIWDQPSRFSSALLEALNPFLGK